MIVSTYDPFSAKPPEVAPFLGVNFGGGVNSTALLLTLYDRNIRPDWVLFADTGSERPETYENVRRVSRWCYEVGFPFEIVRWIRKDDTFESIHDNCLRTGYLPSKAYGYSGCTFKWKIAPMEKWRRKHGFSPTVVCIGYDTGEKKRLKAAEKRACASTDLTSDEIPWYPLVGFGMSREDCEKRIAQEGWPFAKSSCFMCPNMSEPEWDDLSKTHPTLFSQAQEIQRNAEACGNATSVSIFRRAPGYASCMCSVDSGSCEVSENV